MASRPPPAAETMLTRREAQPMPTLTVDDVRAVLGPVDDSLVAEVLATGVSREELIEAYAWITNDEAPMNAGQPPASGRGAQLIEVLEAAVEDEPPMSPL